MAIRVFCDHCGSTVQTSNIFCYGPHKAVKEAVDSAWAHAMGGRQNIMGGIAVPPTQTEELITIDLCNACTKIWMERVGNLTKASDV